MFGFDNRILTNLKVRSIDFDKLEGHRNVKKSFQGDIVVNVRDEKTGDLKSFSSITITKDEHFRSLLLGCKKTGGKKVEYVKLDVFVAEPNGHNLKPISQVEAINKHKEIMEYIYEKYGIRLIDEEAKYGYLEMNETIELEFEYEEYQGTLEAMQEVAPRRYKDVVPWKDNVTGHIKMISYDNKSMRIKVYNKTLQLQQERKIKIEKLYLRFEVCLNDAKKIISVFGTNLVSEITDEMIREYFIGIVKADLFDRMDLYIDATNKALVKKKKQSKKDNKTGWTKDMFSACGNKIKYNNRDMDMVFDLDQILEIIRAEIKTKSNYDRTLKRCKKEIEEKGYKKNNLARYNEIKSKIIGIK